MTTPPKNTLSLRLTRTPRVLITLAAVWASFFCVCAAFVVFMPWTQSVSGSGQVTVFSPMHRPQTVNAEIDGRLVDWKVHEGDEVVAGQVLAQLAEMKPEYLDPQQLARTKGQRDASAIKRDAAVAQLKSYELLINALRRLGHANLPSSRVQALGEERTLSDAGRRLLASEQQALDAARLNMERVEALHAQGLRSTRDLELAKRDVAKAEGDLETKLLDTELKRAAVLEKIGGLESDLLKAETEYSKLARRGEQRLVRAPCDGKVVRIHGVGAGHVFKAGDAMAIVAPETGSQAVELFVSDNDAPLVAPGRRARIQFSGWPALQVSGWPSAAMGTYGGHVAVVDASNDGRGRFRVLIRPDHAAPGEEPWPTNAQLRPGTQAIGWILLDRVPLWFELWRRFNGFPAVMQAPEAGKAEAGKSK